MTVMILVQSVLYVYQSELRHVYQSELSYNLGTIVVFPTPNANQSAAGAVMKGSMVFGFL